MKKQKKVLKEMQLLWMSSMIGLFFLRNYFESRKKGVYKKVNAILAKHNVTVPDVSGVNVKEKSTCSLRLHDSESANFNTGDNEDFSDVQKREGEDIDNSSSSSTGEDQNFKAPIDEVLHSPVRPIIYFDNVEGAIGMIKNLGDIDIGLEEGSKKVFYEAGISGTTDVFNNEEVVKKGNLEDGGTRVEKGSVEDDDVVTNDSLEKEGERVVEVSGEEDGKQQIEAEGKKNVQEMGFVEPEVSNDEILGRSQSGGKIGSVLEKQYDVGEEQKERKECEIAKEKAVGVDDKKSTSMTGSGCEVVQNQSDVAEEAKENKHYYMINEVKYPRTIFEEISLQGNHSTDSIVMGLLVDTMWKILRPTMEKKRVIMYGPLFTSFLVSEYFRLKDFTAKNAESPGETKFVWSTTLSNYLKGKSSTRPGDNRWFVSVDRIYAPMIWSQKKHWVSLCIDLEKSTVSVFDCLKGWTNDKEF